MALHLGGSWARGRVRTDGRRLYWWRETLTVLTIYLVYSLVRNASEGSVSVAFSHARWLMRAQEALGINVEETLQDWALDVPGLIVAMNYIYGSLHFVVTTFAIVYLFRRFGDDYPLWRNTLAVTTVLALVGFVTWPLMPPRLLPEGYGFVDTLARYPTFWSFDSGAIQEVSNQYAAMPSLHFAWALFCACALGPRVAGRAWRLAAAGYPALTLAAIVLTGNHFILDAAGGAAVFGLGYLIAGRFTRAAGLRGGDAADGEG
ncbi:MAG: phosphatase PAP2 family protein [Acidimicrobiia bacterium]